MNFSYIIETFITECSVFPLINTNFKMENASWNKQTRKQASKQLSFEELNVVKLIYTNV